MPKTLTIRHNPDQPEHMKVVFAAWAEGMQAQNLEPSSVVDIREDWENDKIRLVVHESILKKKLEEAGLWKPRTG